MVRVVFTPNLQRHIACPTRDVMGDTVRAALDRVFAGNPQLRSYILDDQDRLRRHVHIYINNERIADAVTLSDSVKAEDEIFVFQALSGG